jgi:hypothetical protein
MEAGAPVPHQAGEKPHAGVGKRSAQSRCRLGDKATPTRPKSREYFLQRLRAIPGHHEKPGGDDGIHRVKRLGEGEHVRFDEPTILQVADVGPVFGARKQSIGQVDAGDLNVRVALRQTTSVEAGAAGYFEEVGVGTGPGAWPKRVGDCCSVIVEEMLTTECVEP